MIFSILGTSNEDEMNFVTDAKAVQYLKSFSQKKRVPFKEIYPSSPAEAIDFLDKTIVFNPYKRLSIEEVMKHPYLSSVRDLSKEIISKNPIILDFEKQDLSVEKLRKLFLDEIAIYHPKK